jgi:hypothetical protein
MDQLCLPRDLENDIPLDPLARVVDAAVNRLNDTLFDATYSRWRPRQIPF